MNRLFKLAFFVSILIVYGCQKEESKSGPITYGSNYVLDTFYNPYKGPLYWSPYEYCFSTDGYIPEDVWRDNIDWVDQNLKAYGFDMVCIDGWGDDFQFNSDGYRLSHSSHWQHDYAWWSTELQSRGMRLGMYANPLWVIKRAADQGLKIKGTDIPLSTLIDPNEDALWFNWIQIDKPGAEEFVKGYIQHFADMGIKYLRVDFLSWYEDGKDRHLGRTGPQRPRAYYETALRWMREACDANGMFLSLVMPHLYQEGKLERQYGHMIRINEDTDKGSWWRWSDNERGVRRQGWSVYANAVDGVTYWSYVTGKNKVILDLDFLRLNTFDTDEERKSVVTLSYISGGSVTISDQFNTIGPHLWLYQNTFLHSLRTEGFVAKPLTNDVLKSDSQIWVGTRSNGHKVVALFNRESTPQVRTLSFTSVGVEQPVEVMDRWNNASLGSMTQISKIVPPHGVLLFELIN